MLIIPLLFLQATLVFAHRLPNHTLSPIPRIVSACTNGKCPAGLICATRPDGRERCIRPADQGAYCRNKPFWQCASGLKCVDNKCKTVVTQGADCKRAHTVCDEGLRCIHGKCIKIVPIGSACVEEYTECERGVCAVKSPTKKMCIQPMKLGQMCRKDPFWACEAGLACQEGRCVRVVQAGEHCVKPFVVCASGSFCAVKSESKKRCVVPASAGGKCKDDPYWVCKDGLKCVDGSCRKIVQSSVGESCVPPRECVDGSICVSNSETEMQCVKPKKVGMKCRDGSFHRCDAGLFCVNGTCGYVMSFGGSCAEKHTTCAEGLSCVPSGDTMRCVRKRPRGDACGFHPFEYCQYGLLCQDGVCIEQVRIGGSCIAPYTQCTAGASCLATSENEKTCVRLVSVGEECSNGPYGKCQYGLVCKNSVCMKEISPGESCVPPYATCAAGSLCAVKSETEKMCIVPMGIGGECLNDPFWVCADNLVCKGNTCVQTAVVGESCNLPHIECEPGTSCLAKSETHKICVRLGVEGVACGGAGMECMSALTCLDGVCKGPWAEQ